MVQEAVNRAGGDQPLDLEAKCARDGLTQRLKASRVAHGRMRRNHRQVSIIGRIPLLGSPPADGNDTVL